MNAKLIQMLKWDTKCFGYKVAKIEAKKLSSARLKKQLELLSRENIRLVYYFTDPKDRISNNAARKNGGLLVDKKLTFTRLVTKSTSDVSGKIQSQLGHTTNIKKKLLSLEAGVYSRFKVDPNFKDKEFEKLYSGWIKNSLNGEMARDVLVYMMGKKEVGLVTLRDSNGRCNIGLIATDSKHRRMGIGKKLMEAAMNKAGEWDYKEMDIVTQKANIASCKFYRKMGYKIESAVNVYHFWL